MEAIGMAVTLVVVVFITALGVISFACWRLLQIKKSWEDRYNILDGQYKKLFHQKKSSEVRLGKIGENLAPFTEHWPWDANNFRFIGSPIDGIQFTEDKIYFVEIKTGKSRLSKYQKKCKQMVDDGKVEFVSFRVGADEVSIN